jgi:hypothetical protein
MPLRAAEECDDVELSVDIQNGDDAVASQSRNLPGG